MAEQEKAPRRLPRKVGVREFRGNFAGFMRQVRDGSSFAITSRDEVIAIVHPPQSKSRRQPGTLRGQIEMAPDFDVLPPELLASLEGVEE
ncbi:type II toxin-antitoxin system Phd/YefM family antitoxin [Methylobacterium sp. J-068]|uniref:type II toxin-antitoxin system Phd/YefM family antitoxin n=1 Tax=Methylobacterium sp. J-068 TaxID=2836649 RepID=UPI001FBB11AA|nr:prevent-host-death protein [Methylobacterium sp. J-068]MCJ2033268.1 prevent-host-death protein [Methylobacterium sp. J-068]